MNSIKTRTFLLLSQMSIMLLPKAVYADVPGQVQVNTGAVASGGLGFGIPTLSAVLTFLIRFFFVIAGLAALLYLLWGSLDWVMSGGDKDKVDKARQKIMAALIGVIVIVATLSIVWALEQVVFQQAICFGLSCPLTLPPLLIKTN
ncbi:MAG: hypothetical protein ACMG6E_01585 [Candidatus Roizmanbacteria bacterium]